MAHLKNSPYILVLVVVVIIKSVSLRNILQVLSDCSKETSMMLGYEGVSLLGRYSRTHCLKDELCLGKTDTLKINTAGT